MTVARITRAGKADVFNMEVEDTHDFVIQGGVVAHNCADSFRYFCMSRPITPRVNVAGTAPVITPGAFALDLYK